jgi:hypothetical protein
LPSSRTAEKISHFTGTPAASGPIPSPGRRVIL